ncbi:MAG: hypothetical protein KTV68_13320 [Acidimicrobiia bacterium]|nr:hypothetical protein [Acidimicrobiia bacterium]MCY4435553.1 hypothetical protein [bacterium]
MWAGLTAVDEVRWVFGLVKPDVTAAVGTVTAVAMGPDGADDPTSLTQEVANWMGAAAAVLTLWVWWVWRRRNERTAEEARRMVSRSINEGGPETDN